jgi:rsbT antagonist protein RsbS
MHDPPDPPEEPLARFLWQCKNRHNVSEDNVKRATASTGHDSPRAMDQSLAIIQIRNCLLVSIQTELHDRLALDLQEALMERVRVTGAKGVILDVSAVEVIDSYITRILNDIGKSVRFMGAECYIVGIRPAVAMTLIEMGVELDSVNTALNLDLALERLELLQ